MGCAPIWEAAQDEMNKSLTDSFDKPRGEHEDVEGVMFDATKLLEIFFKHFNTQELQDCALIQFVSMDIQSRAESHVRQSGRSAMEELMKEMKAKIEKDLGIDEAEGFDEIL